MSYIKVPTKVKVPTESQQKKILYNLLKKKGVPDVLAFMASQHKWTSFPVSRDSYTASQILSSCMVWEDTPEGFAFWQCVTLDCKYHQEGKIEKTTATANAELIAEVLMLN